MWTEIDVSTSLRNQLVEITGVVADEVRERCVENGTCLVYVLHTTAGVTINENADPDVARDILANLARLVQAEGDYRHAEGNSDAHIKASLVGFPAMVPIIGGRPAPGPWQSVYLCEFDGPRQRRVLIGVAGA